MTDSAITEKINCIVETDGLLRDYLNSVVIRDIKARINDDRFSRVNNNQIQAALLLKAIAPCSLKEFAAAMHQSKSAASALVDRMVENSIVKREANSNNRREIILTISPEFEKHVLFVRKEVAKWFAGLIEDLGTESFERWYSVMQQLNTVLLEKINHGR